MANLLQYCGVCAANCEDTSIPIVRSSVCSPSIKRGGFVKMFVGFEPLATTFYYCDEVDNPAAYATYAAALEIELAARVSNSATIDAGDTGIREIYLYDGAMAAPNRTIQELNGCNKKAITDSVYTVTANVLDVNCVTHEFMRSTQCNGIGLPVVVWLVTADGMLYGDQSGISGRLLMEDIVPANIGDLHQLSLSFDFDSLCTPKISVYPLDPCTDISSTQG